MDMPLTKKEIVLERNSVNGPPSAFRDLRTMLAARNLKLWRFGETPGAKHDTGALFSCFLGLHRTADDEQDGWVQDESKTKSNVGEKGDNYNTKRKKKEEKKEISPAPLNMKIPFITFWYPRGVWLSALLIKGRVVTSFSSFLFSEPGVKDYKCYLISISFFILAVSFFSALNDVI